MGVFQLGENFPTRRRFSNDFFDSPTLKRMGDCHSPCPFATTPLFALRPKRKRYRLNATSNLSKPHETRDNLWQFLFADCFRLSDLSLPISSQFTLKVCAASGNRKNTNPSHSACYDKQHVCTYLQSFSRYTSQ